MKKIKADKRSRIISMVYSAAGLALAIIPKFTVCPVKETVTCIVGKLIS